MYVVMLTNATRFLNIKNNFKGYDYGIIEKMREEIHNAIFSDLNGRGVTGFDNAIEAVYPQAEIQQCVIHQIRNTTQFVSYKDIKALMADLKRVYAAVDEEAALYELETFAGNGMVNTQKLRNRGKQTGRNYPPILSIRRRFGR